MDLRETTREGREIPFRKGMLLKLADDYMQRGNLKSLAFLLQLYDAAASSLRASDDVSPEDDAILEVYSRRCFNPSNPEMMIMPKILNRRAFVQAGLRQYFSLYVRRCFMALHPDAQFIENWHIDAILYQLERVAAAKSTA